MDRDTRQAWQIFFIAALLIGITRIVHGQNGTTVVKLGAYRRNLVAETTCSEDNKVVIIFHQDLDTLEYRLTMVHELIHAQAMRKDCKATQTRYRTDEKVRIAMETEAYCEDSKERLKAGQDSAWVKERFYGLMYALYGVEKPVCPFIPP